MYKNVGKVLRKYRSGKIPKAFKVLPSLSNWEQVYKTQPLIFLEDLLTACL